MGIGLGCLAYTQSRGLLLALSVYFLVYFLRTRQKGNLIFLAILALPLLLLFVTLRNVGNYTPPEFRPYLNSARLFIWAQALEYNRDNGLLLRGSGYESGYELTRRTAVGDYFTNVRISKGAWEPDTDRRAGVSLHGGLTKVLFTTGAVGFGLFAWALVMMVRAFSRSRGELAVFGLPWLAAMLTADATTSYFWASVGPLPSIAAFTALGMLLVDALRNQSTGTA